VRTHEIARAQQAVGLEPHVVTRLGYPVTVGRLAAPAVDVVDGIPYHRLLPVMPLPRRTDRLLAANIDAALRLVERLEPSVLHAATDHYNGQVALALRERCGLPVVYEVRGFLEESWLSRRSGEGRGEDTDRYRLARELETWCMREADLVTTLAETMRDEIVGRGIPPERVLVCPNAVDPRFLEAAPDARPLRRRLGIDDDTPIVGLVSTFYAHEGIDVLIRAVALLRSQGVDLRCLLVGDGPERANLQQLAAESGVLDVTLFTGRVPFADTPAYHSAIDVFVVPRTDDRVCQMVAPLKPVEAMAVGRPVVASDVAPLRELVEASGGGVLFTPEEAAALAEAMRPLLYDGALRARLGRRGHDHIVSQRTWLHVAERYRSAYAALGAV
jgi:glycosyltransferase involved in cell wall biosynthesis